MVLRCYVLFSMFCFVGQTNFGSIGVVAVLLQLYCWVDWDKLNFLERFHYVVFSFCFDDFVLYIASPPTNSSLERFLMVFVCLVFLFLRFVVSLTNKVGESVRLAWV